MVRVVIAQQIKGQICLWRSHGRRTDRAPTGSRSSFRSGRVERPAGLGRLEVRYPSARLNSTSPS